MPAHAPTGRPLGLLSDVHGNLAALDAVLAELERRDVRDVVVAGDLLLGGGAPLDVWRRLQDSKARCIRGLSDTALASVDPASLEPSTAEERRRAEVFAETRASIGELILQQLRVLPDMLRLPLIDGGELVVVHGAPADPSAEIGHDLSDEEVLALVGDDPADLVVCGATHVPFDRTIDSVRIVNVGSVGQALEGETAHFSILTPRMDGHQITQDWVAY